MGLGGPQKELAGFLEERDSQGGALEGCGDVKDGFRGLGWGGQ